MARKVMRSGEGCRGFLIKIPKPVSIGLKANIINGEVQLTGIVDTGKEKVNKIVSGLEGVRELITGSH